jgi:hypothetical protein
VPAVDRKQLVAECLLRRQQEKVGVKIACAVDHQCPLFSHPELWELQGANAIIDGILDHLEQRSVPNAELRIGSKGEKNGPGEAEEHFIRFLPWGETGRGKGEEIIARLAMLRASGAEGGTLSRDTAGFFEGSLWSHGKGREFLPCQLQKIFGILDRKGREGGSLRPDGELDGQ